MDSCRVIPPNVDRLLSKPPKLNDLRMALVEVTAERKVAEMMQ